MMSSDSGSESPILNLADIEAGEISRTGGKGANLARLIHAGFPVPEVSA